MNRSEETYLVWPTTNLKNDNALITVSYQITRKMHERFLDKIYTEGYTKQEALTQLIQNYVEGI